MFLTIGSVQFGLKYGFSKKKISSLQIKEIFKIISKNKIKHFDTSFNYGNSEKVIGNFKFEKKIITKISLPKKKVNNIEEWYNYSLNRSLKNLKVKKLYGLLIHNTSDIYNYKKKLLSLIKESKKKKIVEKIGISVYEKKEVDRILKFWTPDIIQFPLNVFNQKFLSNNYLKMLKKLKVETYARSCFLQGILLHKKLIRGNKKSKKIFKNFLHWTQKNKVTQLRACLHFVKQIEYIDSIVVGFDNSSHLHKIIKSFNKKTSKIPFRFMIKEKKLIDPRYWN